MMKICSTCKIEKPIIEFSENKSGKFGRYSKCKKCKCILGYKTAIEYRNDERGFILSRLSGIFAPDKIKRRGLVPECTKNEILKHFDEYVEKNGRNCFYCKEPWTYITNEYVPGEGKNIKSDKGKSRAHKIKNFSIDRLNSSKTYSIDNIIFCCTGCNLRKKDITFDMIKRLYEIITERNL